MLLLLIVSNDFLEAELKNGNRIGELLLQATCLFPSCRPLRLIESLVVELYRLVPLLKPFLELLDLKLKLLLFFLMFGFEREDLVIRLVRVLAALDVVSVSDRRLFLNLGYLLLHLDNAVLGEQDFLAHYINLSLQVLISTDGIV